MNVEYRLDNPVQTTYKIESRFPIRHILVFNGTLGKLTVLDGNQRTVDIVQSGELLQRNVQSQSYLFAQFDSNSLTGVVRFGISDKSGIESIGYAPAQAVNNASGIVKNEFVPASGVSHFVFSSTIVPAGTYTYDVGAVFVPNLANNVSSILITPEFGSGTTSPGGGPFGNKTVWQPVGATFTTTQSSRMKLQIQFSTISTFNPFTSDISFVVIFN